MSDYRTKTVGGIVADCFGNAQVFQEFGIDFCCGGQTSFDVACARAGVDPEVVAARLDSMRERASGSPDFKSWPPDLLLDYVIKYHHRNIRREGAVILPLLEKVKRVHGDAHPWLHEAAGLFGDAMAALESHLAKEEQILFPCLYELFEAEESGGEIPSFHCGSVAAPVSVMMSEHDREGERFRRMEELSGNYTAPADACNSFRLLLRKWRQFDEALHEHIHLENNLLFPAALAVRA